MGNGPTGIVGMKMVETVSLDEYFENKETPIDIIKIDLEGAEFSVLVGMKNIIRSNDNLRIFAEFFCPREPQKSEYSLKEYWDKLVEFGFKYIYVINEQARRLEITDSVSLLRYCEYVSAAKIKSPNLLCTKSAIDM